MACDLAIIVPVFNEEENIQPLAREVAAAFEATSWDYELVFVDDSSSDGTWQRIIEAQQIDARVRGLRLARRCGQSAAIWTGIQETKTPILASIDGDRQNDPEDLPRLLAELQEADFVSGIRTKRQDNWRRRISAKVARWARRAVLKVDFVDTGCALRVFRRTALDFVIPFNGLHRFLPILVYGGGARTREIPVRHRPRVAGQSKYGIWDRLGRGIIDLLAISWYQRRRLSKVAVTRLPESQLGHEKVRELSPEVSHIVKQR